MVNIEIISRVFGIIGNFISFGLFPSTGPIIYRIFKNKSAGDVYPDHYLAKTLHCFFLMLYGLPFIHPGNILLLTAYGTGLVINLAYVVILFLYAKDTDHLIFVRKVFLIELWMMGFVLLVIGLLPTSQERTLTVGVFCYLIGLLMNMPRAILVFKVVEATSLDRMQFLIALCDTLNAFCWFIYAFLRSDHLIAVPYSIGFLYGVWHLALFCVYPGTPESAADKNLATIEVQDQGIGTGAERKLATAEPAETRILDVDDHNHSANILIFRE